MVPKIVKNETEWIENQNGTSLAHTQNTSLLNIKKRYNIG